LHHSRIASIFTAKIYNFKTKVLMFNSYAKIKMLLSLTLFFFIAQSAFADGGIGYKGIYINKNGTKTWYKAHNVSWSYNGCGNYQFYSSSDFSGQNLGSFTSSQTLQIAGFAVIGWTNNTDWVAGKLLYKYWKQGDAEPVGWSEIYIGNYGNGNGATQVVCSSGNDRVVGYDNGTTNINPGALGTYNLKIQALGRMQWSGGFFSANDGTEVTATFTITSSLPTDYFRSKSSGNWNSTSSWESSSNNTNWVESTLVPGSSATAITIQNSHNITLDASVTIPSLTINSGATFTASDATARVLTITKSTSGSATTLNNSGTWANGSGGSTVVFSGAPSSGDAVHAISGTIAFQNITINKTGGSSNVGASFGANSSVSGTLEIGTGGFVSTAPPTSFYGSNAILKFNQGSGATYDVNPADYTWSTTVIPNYITISTGTVNLKSARTASGNLLIDGGTLILNEGLTIQGNWTRTSGTFTPNSQTVTLSGTTNTIINTATDANLYNLVVSKTGGAYVTMENNLTVSNTLSISSGAILKVPSAKSLTVSGTLTNSAGNSGLVIEDGARLMHNTNSVSGTLQRIIAKDGTWHFISSPNTGTMPQICDGNFAPTTLNFNSTTGATFDVFKFLEGVNTNGLLWNNIKTVDFDVNTTDFGNPPRFEAGKGYLVWYNNSFAGSTTKSFAGTLANGAQSIGVTIDNNKFNLIGNPYCSSIDWKAASGWTRTMLASSGGGYNYWAWNGASGNYGVYNSASVSDAGTLGTTRYIGPAQGFFVQATSAGNVGLTNAVRVTNSGAQLKNTLPAEAISVSVSGNSTSFSDEIRIEFGYTSNDDGAAKWWSMYSEAPSLYSVKNDKKLSLNFLTSISENPSIPVAFKAGIDGTYQLAADFESSMFGSIALVDLKTGTEHNLLTNPVYSFESTTTDVVDRFILKFGGVGVDNPSTTQSKIFAYGNKLNIQNPGKALLEVFAITGQKLVTSQINSTGLYQTTLNQPTGYYIVRLTSNGSTQVSKIFIQ
jgi:hypothetical protein